METKQIPLCDLNMAEDDDKLRVWGAQEGIKDLSENIKRYGLLVPLIVKWTGERYIVVDGNRRLAALQRLAMNKEETLDRLVACMIGTPEELELGAVLSANVMRAALNPMDEYDVYARLVVVGETPAKIAKVFGKRQKEIKQVLALAGLHPAIKDELRADKLSWETAQALTIVPDPELQIKVYRECGDSSWRIRNALRDQKPLIAYALFKAEDYEAAGGTYLVDLFNEDDAEKRCANAALFWQLQNQKIDEVLLLKGMEGWHAVTRVGSHFKTKPDWRAIKSIKNKKERKKYNLYYRIEPDGLFEIAEMAEPTAETRKAAQAILKEATKARKNGEAAPEAPAEVMDNEKAERNPLGDHELLLAIQELLDGLVWSSGTLDQIADLMTHNGYPIRDVDDKLPEKADAAEPSDSGAADDDVL
jgi:ParB/RepB/Spo0J family partition protein